MKEYSCIYCGYKTDIKSRWNTHILSKKHLSKASEQGNKIDNISDTNNSLDVNEKNSDDNFFLESKIKELEDNLIEKENIILQLKTNEKILKHNLEIEILKNEDLEKKNNSLNKKLHNIKKYIPDCEPFKEISKNDDVFKYNLPIIPKLNLHNEEIERIRKSITKLSKTGKYLNLQLEDIPKADPLNIENIDNTDNTDNDNIKVMERNADEFLFDPFQNCNSDSDESDFESES